MSTQPHLITSKLILALKPYLPDGVGFSTRDTGLRCYNEHTAALDNEQTDTCSETVLTRRCGTVWSSQHETRDSDAIMSTQPHLITSKLILAVKPYLPDGVEFSTQDTGLRCYNEHTAALDNEQTDTCSETVLTRRCGVLNTSFNSNETFAAKI
ncbi:hypothetical protein J6590_001713 [Homalodisca vitripennis]|nr:hypothetical protein J6590_001713 [Homalodisca vitripennis]